MEPCIQFPLSEFQLKEKISASKDFAYSHGLIVRKKENPESPEAVVHAPYTLIPSPVPRSCFLQAQRVQTDFNILMHRVAHDREFLRDCLKNVLESDEFTRRIFEIYGTTVDEGITRNISLAMNRSDYMFDHPITPDNAKFDPSKAKLRQIEFNTIASSFGGLSYRVQLYHSFILKYSGVPEKLKNLQVHDSGMGLAKGIVEAWTRYGNTNAAVLFLVYPVERNIYDQRWLEYSVITQNSGVKVIRKTLADVQNTGRLDENKCLIVDGVEIAVVYQRWGYVPQDFTSDDDWATRLMMERSRAIVCPSAGYHLAGTKKVQQVLASPGVVERFIKDPEAARRIRDTFAGQYTVDLNAEGNANVEMAIKDPNRFVLKPQREGGGNNTFGDEVRTELQRMKDSKERESFVLMERINPIVIQNYPVLSGSTNSEINLSEMVSELGIYGILVGKERAYSDTGIGKYRTRDEIFVNEQSGHLLRTKKLGTDEGGVATGYSVLDSPYLVS